MTMQVQTPHTNLQRIFRAAILNGTTPSHSVVAQLEAIGINTSELEQRIRQQVEFRH